MNDFQVIKEEFEKRFEAWRTSEPTKEWLKDKSDEFIHQIKIIAYHWFCAGVWAEKEIK